MSSLKEIAKGGWHPKGKDGGEESWRSDFKGINQVAGWMGKGKDTNNTAQHEHVSKPLSSLKDPSSFGPPPKHVKYHGPAALRNETTPDRRGMGAPVPREQVEYQNTRQQQQQPAHVEKDEEQPPRPTPSVPYRADTTGLSTSHLPPPPTRRTDSPAGSGTTQTSRPKPSAPPRAPPRQSAPSPPPAYTAQPPSSHASEGHVNEQATSNLSRAGVSVPALGIDSKADSARKAPPPPPPSRGPSRQPSFPSPPSRTATTPTPSTSSGGGGGGLRERHGHHIDAGKQKVSGINEKYGISRRVNNFIEDQKSPADQGPPPPQHPNRTMSHAEPEVPAARKAPPPPPPKRQEMRATPVNSGAPPPPVPLGTKPR